MILLVKQFATNKKNRTTFVIRFCFCWVARLFLAVTVAAHELIYATSGVNQFALTSVEGVRGVTDFELVEGISFAFELDGVVCLCRRAAEEHIAVAHVLEHYGAIVFGMKSFFHFVLFLCPRVSFAGSR